MTWTNCGLEITLKKLLTEFSKINQTIPQITKKEQLFEYLTKIGLNYKPITESQKEFETTQGICLGTDNINTQWYYFNSAILYNGRLPHIPTNLQITQAYTITQKEHTERIGNIYFHRKIPIEKTKDKKKRIVAKKRFS